MMFKKINISVDLHVYQTLRFKLDYYKDRSWMQRYIDRGHPEPNISIYNVFENDVIPESALEARDKFDWLQQRVVAVNLLLPGQYLPLHADLYGRYCEVKNIKDKTIERWIVMLHDSAPGQIIQIEDQVVGKWMCGDCFGWQNQTMHASYNFSFEPRYALQITGVAS